MATSALTAISNEALQEELAKEILNEEAKREEEKEEDLKLTKQDGKIENSFYFPIVLYLVKKVQWIDYIKSMRLIKDFFSFFLKRVKDIYFYI